MVEWSDGFDPERFEVPPGGLDLREQMEQYSGFDQEAYGLADVDDELDGAGLPPQVLEAVFALEPMQRASLVAMVAASLVDEIDQTRLAMAKLAAERGRGAAGCTS